MSKSNIPKTLKWQVLHRDSYTCRYCGARGVPMAIDHVWPESKGGPTIYENLVTACEPCNSRKKDKLGIYPRPVDYLEKLNRAEAIINWHNEHLQQRADERAQQVVAEAEVAMQKQLSKIEAAFKFRRRVFAAIRGIPTIGIATLIFAGVLMIAQNYQVMTGDAPTRPAVLLVPYILFAVSMGMIPIYNRLLNWYTSWPYPKFDTKEGVTQ